MKNVLMTLFFLAGLVMTQLSAQNCQPCPPCPPGCCVAVCDASGKVCKLDKKAMKNAVATGQCTPAQVEACKTAMEASTTTTTPESVLAEMTVAPVSVTATSGNCQPACCNTKAEKRKNARPTALAQQ